MYLLSIFSWPIEDRRWHRDQLPEAKRDLRIDFSFLAQTHDIESLFIVIYIGFRLRGNLCVLDPIECVWLLYPGQIIQQRQPQTAQW